MSYGAGDYAKGPWLAFRNESGETIPAHGVMKCDGLTTANGGVVLSMVQSTRPGAQFDHFINGPTPVADDDYGQCTRGLTVAKISTSDSTPTYKEQWGPIGSSWELRKNVGGFLIVGEIESGKALVIASPWLAGKVTLNADLNYDGSASADVITDTTETSFDITVEERRLIASGKKIVNGTVAWWNYCSLTDAHVVINAAACEVDQ